MKTAAEVSAWCAGAQSEFGDPSLPVCQLFFRWQANPMVPRGDDELVCGLDADGELVLLLGPEFQPFPTPIETDEEQLEQQVGFAFGAQRITAGVWALNPSLNAEGAIHAFIVLHGVPDPAPWERRIVLP